PTGNGADLLQRQEKLYILGSFYGPHADEIAGVFRDGLWVEQNTAVLRANGMGLIEVDELTTNAELFREQWRYRVDVDFVLNREIRRVYNVRSLLRSQGVIHNNPPGTTGTTDTDWDTDREQ